MPVKIRLSRHGKKRKPIYSVVIADSRAPRDGKFIEKLGTFNPNTNPTTIDINFERALYWLQTGAQPTDTCRTILSEKGVLYKKHLLGGVKKGALTQEQADSKFNDWIKNKESKLTSVAVGMKSAAEKDAQKRMDAETKAKEKRAEAIAKKNAQQIKESAVETVEETTEQTTEE